MASRWRRADAILQNPSAMQALLVDPRTWLRQNRLTEADVACSDNTHAALKQAERVATRANRLGKLPLVDSLPKLRDITTAAWGQDVDVSRIPFGVQIAQRVTVPQVPILDDNPEKTTGTGTIRCTFGLSCKADVDD